VYVSSSLLANWDKKGVDNEQFVKLYGWDGKQLRGAWEVDFYKLALGRPHHMKLGAGSAQRSVAAAQAAMLLGK
jgi:selenium-binding protein 1